MILCMTVTVLSAVRDVFIFLPILFFPRKKKMSTKNTFLINEWSLNVASILLQES